MTDHEESPTQATSPHSDPQALDTSVRQSARPEAWNGPTFVYRPTSKGALFLGGWRQRVTQWDHGKDLLSTDQRTDDLPKDWSYSSLTCNEPDDTSAISEASISNGFLEFVLPTGEESVDPLWDLAGNLLGLDDSQPLKSLPEIGSTSGTSNRPLSEDCKASLNKGIHVADLRFTAMPNSHGDRSRRLQYATRHVRLLRSEKALVAVWDAPIGSWDPAVVTWPHHAVPGLDHQTLQALACSKNTAESLRTFLLQCLKHEAYFLKAWRSELDHWESWIFTAMAEGSAVLRDLELGPDVRGRAGALSSYLNAAQLDLRTFERRLSVEPLLNDQSKDTDLLNVLTESQTLLSDNQGDRREAQTLLASLAAGEQLQAARDQVEAAERQAKATARLEATLLWLGALLLLPGLIVGIYGANLRELDPSVEGSIPMLALWTLLACSLFALIAGFLISPRGRSPWIMAALGVTAIVTALLSALTTGTLIAWLLAAGVAVTWLFAGTVLLVKGHVTSTTEKEEISHD